MKSLQHLLDSNEAWAKSVKEANPDFFSNLSKQQTPKYLWIGCSDSRVPANQIVNLPPGEVFVHRNIANVVVHTDLNCLSVIQYAVEVLRVEHIIVCGHYGCGGIKAAIDDHEHGLIDNWLRHIKDVQRFNAERLAGLSEEETIAALCELNISEQMKNVCNTTVVKLAWQAGQELAVHGWIYSMEQGTLKELASPISSQASLEALY